jgi:hypothetical protein
MSARWNHTGAGRSHRAPRNAPRMSAAGFVAVMASIPALITLTEMMAR